MSRRAGQVREPGDFHPGDHICWTYASDNEHRRVLTAFVAQGLQAGERVAYFAPRGQDVRLLEYLRACGVNPDPLVVEGVLVLGRAEDAYSASGSFDAGASLAGFRAMAQQAVADRYTGLRVAGENAWILTDPSYRALWPAYEVRVDRTIASLPLIGMCSFDLRECGDEIAQLMDAVHPLRLGAPAAESKFHLHSDHDSGVVVQGELDLATSDTVASLLQALAEEDVVSRIDLSGLEFADVQGMRAIAGAARAMAETAGTLRIEDAPKSFSRAWQLLRLDQALPVELTSSGQRS